MEPRSDEGLSRAYNDLHKAVEVERQAHAVVVAARHKLAALLNKRADALDLCIEAFYRTPDLEEMLAPSCIIACLSVCKSWNKFWGPK